MSYGCSDRRAVAPGAVALRAVARVGPCLGVGTVRRSVRLHVAAHGVSCFGWECSRLADFVAQQLVRQARVPRQIVGAHACRAGEAIAERSWR